MKTRSEEITEWITAADKKLTQLDEGAQKLKEKRESLVQQRLQLFSPADNILRRYAGSSKELPSEAPDTSSLDNQIKDIDIQLAANTELALAVSGERGSYIEELEDMKSIGARGSIADEYLAVRYFKN